MYKHLREAQWEPLAHVMRDWLWDRNANSAPKIRLAMKRSPYYFIGSPPNWPCLMCRAENLRAHRVKQSSCLDHQIAWISNLSGHPRRPLSLEDSISRLFNRKPPGWDLAIHGTYGDRSDHGVQINISYAIRMQSSHFFSLLERSVQMIGSMITQMLSRHSMSSLNQIGTSIRMIRCESSGWISAI